MNMLSDEKIIDIAKSVATANNITFTTITAAPTLDSTGSTAIEIRIVLTPGSSDQVVGLPSALTTSQVIQKLADEGEERFPIVRYEYRSVSPST
jgi:hypothetical protein